ncbi:hypothetical protein PoMZ_02453 [Pyricularia oryzae]|uniref:Uncharacterized protein n=1 Tax=Pyricularia oryzae TaxID=318829 RepID=A0A4P7N947_PYROR|nr:hypothetical protein PoMZ_02453 [Pyricularia oryzae]
MFHIRFSSLAPCSVLCPLLAISQKAVFTSTSPVPETSLSTRESKGAPKSLAQKGRRRRERRAPIRSHVAAETRRTWTTATSAHSDCDVRPVAGVRMDGPHRQFDTMEMKAMERGPKKDDFECAHDEQPASGLQAEW